MQGFPEDFKFPEGMANSHKYKQAGNCVTVSVIERIATNIVRVLEGETIDQEEIQNVQNA